MDFKLASQLSRIDYHLNAMAKELFVFAYNNKSNLTDKEFNVLKESIDKIDEALNNITDNIKY